MYTSCVQVDLDKSLDQMHNYKCMKKAMDTKTQEYLDYVEHVGEVIGSNQPF